VCDAMRRQNLPHEHRSLRFRVQTPSGTAVEFRPEIVARRGSILFLVESLAAAEPARLELLSRFLDQHSPEIVLVLLADRETMARIPPEAYDELYDAGDVATVVRRIRLQEPGGIIRPFPKPRSGADL
jgi:hypothetical protein